MESIKLSIDINAPLDKVFNYVSNVETHPKYARFCEKLWITSDKKVGVGVKFVQVQKHGSSPAHNVESEIVEYDPSKKVVWKNLEPHSALISYFFEIQGKGTRLIHVVESGFLDDKKEKQNSFRENEEELANLKRLLEH